MKTSLLFFENTSSNSRHAYTIHVIDQNNDYPDWNWLQRPNLPLKSFMNDKKIILDCDPGHDAVAIMLAAASSEIEILGITCVGGNSGLNNTVNNALKVCTLIERTDLKIYSGANKPIHYDLFTAEYVHGKSGLDKKGDP